jgi:hypothetical protein
MAKISLALGVCALAIAGLAPAAGKGPDYAGFWKRNCADGFGLQIRPLRGGLYAVSFCNHDGCSAPGAYRPNTRIQSDPMYEVLSPTRIRLRHQEGGFSTYVRCTSDTGPASLPR